MALTPSERRELEGLYESIRLNPNSLARDQWKKAIERLEALEAERPEKTAERLESMGEYEEARDFYHLALVRRPKDNVVIKNLGNLCFRMGRTQEGVAQFKRLADFYAAEGFLCHAMACLRRILRDDPGNVEIRRYHTTLYIMTKIKLPACMLGTGH